MENMYPLMVYNSLTRTKVRFIPADPNHVTWYQCGPTVYAESHLGHARTYVSLDVIRRITKEFLGYNVLLCQNVTDIDDKIIIRSSERGIPFRELAAKYEQEFLEDMAMLGVQPPDMMTRVSEYIPEIISYIEKLITRGCAYASNGSVYFDTTSFEKLGHKYGKLVPEQVGNSELLAEGEGALSVNDDKRTATDFALWKKTKEQSADSAIVEPYWDSPWGRGRPGWHIECSAMSGSAMRKFGGGRLDVHAGGVDLKFPHHENEIAQSEGHECCNQWVSYWLHTGHLNIKGFKMSKSLKNFKTIREALNDYTSRQIRFCFLLHKYNETMDYDINTMTQAIHVEKIFSEFFHNCKAVLRRLGVNNTQHIGAREETLLLSLESVKAGVRAALLDDFDTPKSISHLQELIKECNRYMEDGSIATCVLMSCARYVTSILRLLGLIQDGSDIGFNIDASGSGDGSNAGASREQTIAPLLDILTKFRESVRIAAISGDTKAVLTAADNLRDFILPEVGVRMEDKGSGANVVTVWKLDDPEVLRKERAQKEELAKKKEEEKAERLRLQQEREAKAKIPPSEMFLSQTDLYSAFDATGMPTHDKAGEPLSKGAIKKLQKQMASQAEAHEKYLARGGSTGENA